MDGSTIVLGLAAAGGISWFFLRRGTSRRIVRLRQTDPGAAVRAEQVRAEAMLHQRANGGGFGAGF